MTTYYVDPKATGTSDLNPGTYAGRPLKTLAKAAALALSGDKIMVHSSIYYEQVTTTKSGVEWYAVDEGVIIDGSDAFSASWTSVGSGVYSAPYNPPVGSEPFGLVVDGLFNQQVALSLGAINRQYDPITTLVYSSFYFDRAANLLYLNIGGGSPAGHDIRVGRRSSAFTLSSVTGCMIDGFHVRNSNQYGIRINGGGSHYVINGEANHCAQGGIRLDAPSPQIFNPSDAGAGGTLTAGTKWYRVTAVVGGVETFPSLEDSITIAANRKVQIQCSNVVGATSYKIYGRTQANETLLATIAAPGSGFPTYVDDGSATPDGTTFPPNSSTVSTGANVVENNDVHTNGSHGIYLFSAIGNTVKRNRSHHNRFHGIALINYANGNTVALNRCYKNNQLNNRIANGIQCDFFGVGSPGSSDNIIQRNQCFKNQDSGISIYQGSHNCIVRYNLCYDNGDHGIDNLNSQNTHMIGNTIYYNPTAGLNAEGTPPGVGSAGIRMYNNILVDNGYDPAAAGGTSGNFRVDQVANADAVVDYNLSWLTYTPAMPQAEVWWGTFRYPTLASFKLTIPSQMVHGFSGDPLFASVPNRDFHLQAGSPAIHAGYGSAPDISGDDFDGLPFGTPPNLGVYS